MTATYRDGDMVSDFGQNVGFKVFVTDLPKLQSSGQT